jgi:S-adenosylmethionine:tRNA ribosyltransferase-isomerase
LRQRYDFVSSRKAISILDYDYSLPEEKIARYPLQNRDHSKLLIYESGQIREDQFNSIVKYIPQQCSLFYNNTRVIKARLFFQKETGALIELLCLTPYEPSDYAVNFTQTRKCVWICIVGNLKKWKSGKLQLNLNINNTDVRLEAEKVGSFENDILVSFTWNGGFNFVEILNEIGSVPIPPYLNRKSEEVDTVRYQTIYSKLDGSVAAPTAGLHFTNEVLEKISRKEVSIHAITLHVGAGTFQPVKTYSVLDHSMHSEFFTIDRQILVLLSGINRPIIATGTTTLRALESLYWIAVKSIQNKKIETHLGQWEPGNLPDKLTMQEAFSGLLELLDKEGLNDFSATTQIMIVPGYIFKTVNALITNFHQPKSTLLLLIAAFVGDNWKDIYDYALKNDFRFLSYGDCSLLWR